MMGILAWVGWRKREAEVGCDDCTLSAMRWRSVNVGILSLREVMYVRGTMPIIGYWCKRTVGVTVTFGDRDTVEKAILDMKMPHEKVRRVRLW